MRIKLHFVALKTCYVVRPLENEVWMCFLTTDGDLFVFAGAHVTDVGHQAQKRPRLAQQLQDVLRVKLLKRRSNKSLSRTDDKDIHSVPRFCADSVTHTWSYSTASIEVIVLVCFWRRPPALWRWRWSAGRRDVGRRRRLEPQWPCNRTVSPTPRPETRHSRETSGRPDSLRETDSVTPITSWDETQLKSLRSFLLWLLAEVKWSIR